MPLNGELLQQSLDAWRLLAAVNGKVEHDPTHDDSGNAGMV